MSFDSPTPSRQFHDTDRRSWVVRERPGDPASVEVTSRPALIFESATVIRRVTNYPSDWLELSTTQLEALSWER